MIPSNTKPSQLMRQPVKLFKVPNYSKKGKNLCNLNYEIFVKIRAKTFLKNLP